MREIECHEAVVSDSEARLVGEIDNEVSEAS